MLDFLPLGGATTVQESTLLVLLAVIAGLFAATVVFSSYAIYLRFHHAARARRWTRLTQRWQQPVLHALAEPETIPAVHELVGDGEGLHFVGFVLEYSRRVRGEERATLRALVRPYLDRVAERASARATEVRARAIQTLGALGLPDHVDTVVAALEDPSPLVAMVAGRALSRQGAGDHSDAVLARVGRFEGWNRWFLAAMLAGMGPEASEALRRGLADESAEPWTRAVKADALRLQGDFLAGDVAAEVVGRAGHRNLLTSCLRLLAAVGRPEHLEAIRPHCDSEDIAVRALALHALGSTGGLQDLPRLLDAMDDPFPWAALYAARGVREAGGREFLIDLAASTRAGAALAEQVLSEEETV